MILYLFISSRWIRISAGCFFPTSINKVWVLNICKIKKNENKNVKCPRRFHVKLSTFFLFLNDNWAMNKYWLFLMYFPHVSISVCFYWKVQTVYMMTFKLELGLWTFGMHRDNDDLIKTFEDLFFWERNDFGSLVGFSGFFYFFCRLNRNRN